MTKPEKATQQRLIDVIRWLEEEVQELVVAHETESRARQQSELLDVIGLAILAWEKHESHSRTEALITWIAEQRKRGRGTTNRLRSVLMILGTERRTASKARLQKDVIPTTRAAILMDEIENEFSRPQSTPKQPKPSLDDRMFDFVHGIMEGRE